jgi:hypothetical protein
LAFPAVLPRNQIGPAWCALKHEVFPGTTFGSESRQRHLAAAQ